ncbi:MAG: guanitoxin biosynthesis PLP-dependent transaminase GntE [Anaerolineales bacterium]|jgi:glutamate-1-semialdehyde 2,1-aminomutase|nr:guanitoxin biosynthesis PLP-dependent transaminase GntE [Anaerolineales bacterium]
MKNFSKNQALQRRAYQVTPLGVNSNFRYWGDGLTPYVERGKGACLWDVDGNSYIDYRMAFGPIILGHAVDEVDDKVAEEIRRGVLFAMTGELEIEVEEMLIEMVPGLELVRLACSGTEATMHAIRVARAYTGRELILKFEGNYHGFHDNTLWSTYAPVESYGNSRSPIPIPASSGIPRSLGSLIITLPFNDKEAFERAMFSYGHLLAAVITEPCQGNCGAILPAPGFLELIQQKCAQYGSLFILDEVKTGFRIANGGAQEYYDLKPDLMTYAKALGNGYPAAAFGGKREVMSIIGQGVAQGGTYTNNKPGVAGAWATLKILKEKPILKTIATRGQRLMDGLSGILTEAGLAHCMNGYPAMFSYAIGVEKVTSQRDWNQADHAFYLNLVDGLIERGVMPDRDAREPWFLCHAHTEKEIDDTLMAFREVVQNRKK